MTEKLARVSSRHPWRVVTVWVVVVVASVPVIGMFPGDVLTSDVETTSQTESKRANELLSRAFPRSREAQQREISEVVVVRSTRGNIAGPAAEERVAALSDGLRAAGATAVITSASGTELISSDGDARAVLVGLGFDGDDDVPAVYDVVQRLDGEPGYEAAITRGVDVGRRPR
jgi:RND superfamily putative drug exporter